MARQRRRKDRSDRMSGLALGAFGILLIFGLIAGNHWVRTAKQKTDAETLCPLSGPKAVHALIIDRSDPITELQAQRVKQVVHVLKTNAEFGKRFDIYTFVSKPGQALEPVLRICSPGKPENANELIDNPKRVRKTYEDRFSSVIDKTIDDLIKSSMRHRSPILESLRAAAQKSFGEFVAGDTPLRLTLISDLIQHSSSLSHYRVKPDFGRLKGSFLWASLRPQLKGAEVDALYLLRPEARRNGAPVQTRGHQVFWEQVIAHGGGVVQKIEPL